MSILKQILIMAYQKAISDGHKPDDVEFVVCGKVVCAFYSNGMNETEKEFKIEIIKSHFRDCNPGG